MTSHTHMDMSKIDAMVFLPQLAALALLCLVGVIDISLPLSALILPIFGTVCLASFTSGLLLIPAKNKNVPATQFATQVFIGTLLLGWGITHVD